MNDDLTQLNDWITPLLNKFNAAERRKLMVTVARELRRRNQTRIRKQFAPDGTPFAPRLRSKHKQIRRAAMFNKLAQAKYMRTQSSPDMAAVTWLGRTAKIAQVHHFGLRDRVSKNGPIHNYTKRELLGFDSADHTEVIDIIISYLAN